MQISANQAALSRTDRPWPDLKNLQENTVYIAANKNRSKLSGGFFSKIVVLLLGSPKTDYFHSRISREEALQKAVDHVAKYFPEHAIVRDTDPAPATP